MKKLISVLFLLVTFNVFAGGAATILFVKAKVVSVHGGSETPLSRGSSLNVGDTIKTTAGASATIKYTNGTLVTLGDNSNYTIISYTPDQANVLTAELKKGKLNLKTNGKRKETLKTPAVALAILGTEGNVLVGFKGGSSKPETNVQVIQGQFGASGKTFGPGDSFAVSSSGVVTSAPFPSEGVVETPAGVTSEESSTTSEQTTGSSEDSSTSSSDSSSNSGETSVDTGSASAETDSATDTGFVATTAVADSSSTSSTESVAAATSNSSGIAVIGCSPQG